MIRKKMMNTRKYRELAGDGDPSALCDWIGSGCFCPDKPGFYRDSGWFSDDPIEWHSRSSARSISEQWESQYDSRTGSLLSGFDPTDYAAESDECAPHRIFGVALNGVPFDPGTARFWKDDPRSGWDYDALSGRINLGFDGSNAHVQPNGAYHYHGIPNGLLRIRAQENRMTLLGYADGFPIYGPLGYADALDTEVA